MFSAQIPPHESSYGGNAALLGIVTVTPRGAVFSTNLKLGKEGQPVNRHQGEPMVWLTDAHG